MKKSVLVFILAIVMVFYACNGTTPSNSSNPSLDSSQITSTPNQSSEPNNSSYPVDSNPVDSSPADDYDCSYSGHKDGDDDGYCDACTEWIVVNIDFYAINDLHGKFKTNDTNTGVEGLTTYIKNKQAQNENSVVLSSGDMWQGSSESNLTYGAIITEWMNELDTVSMTLGNHEYDWGEDYIISNAELADFPFLAINIFDTDTDKRVSYCEPSVMVERSGVKIGIIGAIGDCYSSISADKVEDVYFKTGDDLTALVKAESQKLRSEGADIIVYSLHDGYGSSSSSTKTVSNSQLYYYGRELSSEGHVDLVFEGHSHKYYILKDTYGIYHLQGGGDHSGISQATISFNTANKSKAVSAKYVRNSTYSSLTADPIVEQLLEKYKDQISVAYEVCGYNSSYRNSNELRQILAELYLKKGIEQWGDKYEVVLGGGFMSARSPYNLEAGEVTYSMLQAIFPFDNALVLCSIKGSDLLSRFIFNDDDRYFVAYEQGLENSVQEDKTYYIIVDKYSSTYADNKLTEIEVYPDANYFARDMLAEYITEGNMCKSSSIEEILQIGSGLAVGASTTQSYITIGKIISIDNQTYGNMTIEDENGNTLYVFGVYDLNGVRYDGMTNKPAVGDTITVSSVIKNYNGTIEFVNATLLSIVKA